MTTDTERPSAYNLLWRAREILPEIPGWLDYVRGVYSVDPGGYPFLSYLGINFTKDTIKNYKLYFSFYKPLTAKDLDLLLPVSDRGHFEQLYAQWHPTHAYKTIHRGVTFAIKIEPLKPLTYYYHLRLLGLPFGLPERLTLAESDLGNHHGACEEFSGGKIHLKRYFYAYDKRTIAQSLLDSGLPDRSQNVDCVEYIESDGRDKYAWISDDPDLIGALLNHQGQPRLLSGLALLARTCRFQLFGPGSAKDGSDHSIYFTEDAGPRAQYGYLFDGARSFLERYLKVTDLLRPIGR